MIATLVTRTITNVKGIPGGVAARGETPAHQPRGTQAAPSSLSSSSRRCPESRANPCHREGFFPDPLRGGDFRLQVVSGDEASVGYCQMPRFVYFIFTKRKGGIFRASSGSHTVSTGNTSIL